MRAQAQTCRQKQVLALSLFLMMFLMGHNQLLYLKNAIYIFI